MSFTADYRGDLIVETLAIADYEGDFRVSASLAQRDFRGDLTVSEGNTRVFSGDFRVAHALGSHDFQGRFIIGSPSPGSGYGPSHARRQRRFGVATLPAAPPPTTEAPMYVSPTSFFYAPLPDNAQIDPSSDAAVADLVLRATKHNPSVGHGGNSADLRVMPATAPLVPVRLMQASWNGVVPGYAKTMQSVMATGVPIPDDWIAPEQSDASGSFWQPDWDSPDGLLHGRMFEVWKARRDTDGSWIAAWGGRMSGTTINPGHFVDRHTGAYKTDTPADPDSCYEDSGWGTAATSIPLAPGKITALDAARGRCTHALKLAVPQPGVGHVWPAQRHDGGPAVHALIEGQRFRLPAGTQPPAGVHPICALVVQAARDYSLFVGDKSGYSIGMAANTDVLPFFLGLPGYKLLDGFPWADLQLLAPGSDADPNPVA